jgi:NAD(P)H-flavin reductase
VRGGGRFADTLRRLGPGDTVEVSRPLGPGFPLVEARGRNVWLVGVGSGIAALRPVVEVLLAEPEAWGKLHLIFGTRGPGHIPFLEDLERWRQRGIDVILTASRAHDGEAWSGHRGYVQDLLLHLAPEMGEAVIFACGMPSMIESVRGAAAKLGLDPGRVITNTVREES